MKKAIVVAGPTASGKSALALALAEKFDGVVINADSMQVYDLLRIITARPSAEDEARAPHRLYGVLAPSELCSVGRWRDLAVGECHAAWDQGRLPIITGGTGLYIRSLMEGISPIPEIPEDVRAQARALLADLGNDRFHALLAQHDPDMGARLHPSNSQRLSRAWEVLQATGRSLADWQNEPAKDLLPCAFLPILVAPPRELLYQGCDKRFLTMLDQGALEEVKSLLELRLDPALPAMKALGVPELAAFLRNEMSRTDAITQAQKATRNYAKRQLTWFRHQLASQFVLDAQFSERFADKIFSLVRGFLLTEPQ